jgi:3-oxoacyl-(acyl-carrier-protein) synthase
MHDPAREGIPCPPFPLYRPPRDAERDILHEQEIAELPADAELRLSLAALRLALRDARLEDADLASAALVLTYEAPGMDLFLRGLSREFFAPAPSPSPAEMDPAAAFLAFYRRHRDAVYLTHSFIHLHLAARFLELHGPTLFANNACASGLYAIEEAADFLRGGKAQIALIAGAEAPTFPAKMLWFQEQGLYAEDGRILPFDRDRHGLVFGVGGAALVLERLDHAAARGAPVYAEYLGSYANQEAWKVAVPNLAEDYYEECLRGTCRRAAIEPDEVDLVNAHGAGTPLSDLYEARGITRVFGDWPERPPITAFKPFFGHTLGACALLETCALLLCLQHGWIPPTPGFETADPNLKLEPVKTPRRTRLATVLKMSNGFAGFNAGAVFRKRE